MVLIGIGVDMVELSQIDKMLRKNEEWIIEKVLSKKERDYYKQLNNRKVRLVWVSKCLAIKEATYKAINQLMNGKFNFLNIELCINDNEKTNIFLSKINLIEMGVILHHSISYTSENVMAIVTAEKLKGGEQ